MATLQPQQTQQHGPGSWTRARWLVISAIVIAVIAAIVLLVVYSGGSSGGGGTY